MKLRQYSDNLDIMQIITVVILESQKQLCRELERSLEEALILVRELHVDLYSHVTMPATFLQQ